MKKIYFAGKFNLIKDKSLSLSDRLINDYRSIILNDSKLLTYYNNNLVLLNNYIYSGPFYCEQASNGDFTSTDCNVVLNNEYDFVKNSDIYFCLFNESFSVGTIVELEWAINLDKEIIIYYKEEDSNYDIKSEYWFAICDAIKNSKKIKVFKYNDIKEVINSIKKGSIFNEV